MQSINSMPTRALIFLTMRHKEKRQIQETSKTKKRMYHLQKKKSFSFFSLSSKVASIHMFKTSVHHKTFISPYHPSILSGKASHKNTNMYIMKCKDPDPPPKTISSTPENPHLRKVKQPKRLGRKEVEASSTRDPQSSNSYPRFSPFLFHQKAESQGKEKRKEKKKIYYFDSSASVALTAAASRSAISCAA